jgi:PadR family transcriptional regulator AphA
VKIRRRSSGGACAQGLTQQMRRSLDYCWPTAESVLYHEPKRLVGLGLATAKRQAVGRRTRTLYAITEQGRRVLADWLATPPSPPGPEVEAMLRLLYADQGSKQDLLDSVRATRAWALARAPEGLAQVRGYLTDGGPFPERLHLIALFGRFYLDLFELLVRWADLAEAEITAWPHTADLGMTDRTRALLEEMLTRLQPLADRAAGQSTPGPAGPKVLPTPSSIPRALRASAGRRRGWRSARGQGGAEAVPPVSPRRIAGHAGAGP